MADRTVHASDFRGEVVRYDRAGKWYYEPAEGQRSHVNLNVAVETAVYMASRGGDIHFGRKGGRTFDTRVRAYLAPNEKRATING